MKARYFDHAAATPLDKDAGAAMEPYHSAKFYNPSATYLAGREIRRDIERARNSVARQLGAQPGEIIFTSGGTESNNLAINGVLKSHTGGHIIASAIEHDSVLRPAGQYPHSLAPVDKNGIVDIAKLKRLITSDTVLVSIMYANNEIGTIQPVKEISQVIETVRKERSAKGNGTPLYFHCDACQATNYLDLHVSRLGVDLMTLNGGKIYGPKQSGILYIDKSVRLTPLITGGGQEYGVRSGTENVPAIIGFATALEKAQKMRKTETARQQQLQRLFIQELQTQLPGVVVNGSMKHRLPNNVHITLPGSDNERLMMQLDEMGIQCAVGSACSASSEEPSHVLAAVGMSARDIRASLRFTMGRQTSEADVRAAVAALASQA